MRARTPAESRPRPLGRRDACARPRAAAASWRCGRSDGACAPTPRREVRPPVESQCERKCARRPLGLIAPPPTTSRQPRQRRVIGQVDLQRRDRHMAVGGGVEVGALARLARVAGRADPVDGLAARAGLRDHRLAGMAAAEPGDAPRQLVGIGAIRDVHVEQPRRPPARLAKECSTSRAPPARRHRDRAQPFSTCENAMAGMPNRNPSMAAATVPE